MKHYILIGKAFRLKCLIQRIMQNSSAVKRQKGAFTVRLICETHIFPKPTFNSATFVIITPTAFFIIIFTPFKSVHVKLTYIITNILKILYKLTVCHISTPNALIFLKILYLKSPNRYIHFQLYRLSFLYPQVLFRYNCL